MKVAVVGAGRVGVVSGLALFELGHDLTLLDVDGARVATLAAGEMPFFEPDASELLRQATSSDRWLVTNQAAAIAGCDVVLITVPTPVVGDGTYELAAVREVVSSLARLRGLPPGVRWRGVFLRSTVLPGTTERVVRAGLESAPGGAPCPVGYLPEFLREGSALADARRPDRVVVGADTDDLRVLVRELFRGMSAELFETGVRTAELIKTANNALLSTCISFANEIARIAEVTGGVDAVEVFEGIHLDRRFRDVAPAGLAEYFLPGPGFGGSCLAKDLEALAVYAKTRRQDAALLEAVSRVNRSQPVWFVDCIDRAIGGLAGRRVLVLGLAFKPETDDSRDSIALPILRELVERGAVAQVHDPRATAAIDPGILAQLGVATVADDAFDEAFDAAEVAVLVTAWPIYLEALPDKLSERSTALLFADARGRLRRVERAPGVTYLSVGAGASNVNGDD